MSDAPPRPVLGASLAVFRDGAVLIARRGRGAMAGLWSLPGGRVEFGETAAQAAVREFLEETGAEARVVGFAGLTEIVDRDAGLHFVVAAHAGLLVRGEPSPSEEASEVAWAAPEALARFETTPGLAAAVARAAQVLP